MKTLKMLAVAGAITAAASLGACQNTHSDGASSKAKAMASSTAAQQVQQDIKRCIPTSGFAQLQLGKHLMSDTAAHPNGSRDALAQCVGITKANKQPFENDVINAAERGHLLTHAGRVTFFQVTLPAIVAKYASAGTVTP